MRKHLLIFAEAITKRWWWLVIGVIGGAQSIASGLGYTPHVSWIIGIVILVFSLLVASFLAYRDLYMHLELEIEKQPRAPTQPYQKRKITAGGRFRRSPAPKERVHETSGDYEMKQNGS